MTKKQKHRLNWKQRTVRNFILAFLLFIPVLADSFSRFLLLPMEWKFRLLEQERLIAPASNAAVFSVGDALEELEAKRGEDLPDLSRFSEENGLDQVAVGAGGDTARLFYRSDEPLFEHDLISWSEAHERFFLLDGLPGAAVFLFDTFDFGSSFYPAAAALAVCTDLPAATVEAEYEYENWPYAERITGSAEVRDGAALLILLAEDSPEMHFAGEQEGDSGVLHLTLRDSFGQIIYERTGPVDRVTYYWGGGGWTDEG